ncbi:MAG: helix-turn-helix transcriptional regulator [Enterocloster citroniae]|nr:helix-turn-helix transcriptional regulator [Enterocloster citroniae]
MKRITQPTPLGMEIKAALLERNMTAKELAQRIDKSQVTVSDVISGKNKSNRTIGRIKQELGIGGGADGRNED